MNLGFGFHVFRRFVTVLCAALFFALAMSCQRQHTDQSTEAIELKTNEIKVANDPFDLIDASISGDSLMLSVRYGGGCSEHVFALDAGPMLKSLPPKQLISVSHNANGDNCRALIQKTIGFDLSSFQGSPRGITIIVLDGTELVYEYR